MFNLHLAVQHLLNGGVVAHPTEGVWGLACLPDDDEAVQRLIALKGRDPAKGLILISDDARRLEPWTANLTGSQRDLLTQYWPGPNTLVIPDPTARASEWVRGQHQSVAMRVTDHSLSARLCSAVGSCLVSSSANPAGRPAPFYEWQVRRYFGREVDFYLSGATGGRRQPSRIIDVTSGQSLR